MKDYPQRKPNRLQDYDYSFDGAYFVTICTKNHKHLFGKLVGATAPGRPYFTDAPFVSLNKLGRR